MSISQRECVSLRTRSLSLLCLHEKGHAYIRVITHVRTRQSTRPTHTAPPCIYPKEKAPELREPSYFMMYPIKSFVCDFVCGEPWRDISSPCSQSPKRTGHRTHPISATQCRCSNYHPSHGSTSQVPSEGRPCW